MNNTVLKDGIHYGLPELERDCWVRLLNGTLKGKDAMHTAYLANHGNNGINLRTVVLRKVDTQQKTLCFHTDNRSGKWEEIERYPHISWLFYDAAAKIQIRAAGLATLFTNNTIADEAWQKLNANSRKTYMGIIPPSQVVNFPTSGLDPNYDGITPSLPQTEFAKEYFGMVIVKIAWMEWLWLSSTGHRRANFNYLPDNSFESNWITP